VEIGGFQDLGGGLSTVNCSPVLSPQPSIAVVIFVAVVIFAAGVNYISAAAVMILLGAFPSGIIMIAMVGGYWRETSQS
jgi:ABC-type transport system involved in cytochrome bd biosynthesis fused ATPase/permease subunit